jgi:four helix bundle protein
MAQTDSTVRVAPAPTHLDAERLDVYRLALDFQRLAARVIKVRGIGSLRDQLDRASVSIALNIAEGAGRRTGADKAGFYVIARGSAMECAAILDVLVGRGLLATDLQRQGRGALIRIVQMLTRLVARHARP